MRKFYQIIILCMFAVLISSEAKCQSIKDADWWLPRKEIGMKHGFGNVAYSREFTFGYRLDDRWTVGLSYSMERTAGLYTRRYFYLGEKYKCAVYVDGMVGANFMNTPEFVAKIEPGIMFRFFNNHQVYIGPSIDTHGLGFHVGFAI